MRSAGYSVSISWLWYYAMVLHNVPPLGEMSQVYEEFIFFLKTQVSLPATTRFFSPLKAPIPPFALPALGLSHMICADCICHGITDSEGKEEHWVRKQKTEDFQSLYNWVPIFKSKKVKNNNNNSTSLCIINSHLNGFLKSGLHGPNQYTTSPLHILCLDIWGKTQTRLPRSDCGNDPQHETRGLLPRSAPCTEEGLDFNRTNTSDSKARPEILWNKRLWASSSGDTRSYLTASLIPSLWCPCFTREVKITIKINFGWIVKIMKKLEVLLHYRHCFGQLPDSVMTY